MLGHSKHLQKTVPELRQQVPNFNIFHVIYGTLDRHILVRPEKVDKMIFLIHKRHQTDFRHMLSFLYTPQNIDPSYRKIRV
jgi:hypothetical protein